MSKKFDESYSELKQSKSDLEKQIAKLLDEFEEKYFGVFVKKLKIETNYEGKNEVSAKIDFNI